MLDRKDATVLDVREPGEYVAGHVPGSALMPMGQLASRRGELGKARPGVRRVRVGQPQRRDDRLAARRRVRRLLRQRRHRRLGPTKRLVDRGPELVQRQPGELLTVNEDGRSSAHSVLARRPQALGRTLSRAFGGVGSHLFEAGC